MHSNRRQSRKLVVAALLMLVMACLPGTADTTIWPDIPMVQRILRSGQVVVGKLVDVQKNSILIKHENYKGRRKNFHVHLDAGTIQATRVLFPVPGPRASLSNRPCRDAPAISPS